MVREVDKIIRYVFCISNIGEKMKLLLVDNAHIFQTPDGEFYSPSIYSDEFFERYLRVFDNVRFVSKVKKIENDETDNLLHLSNKRVEIYPIPWYQGGKALLKKLPRVIMAYRKAGFECECCILRIAQIESFFAYIFSGCFKQPFAVEMVNDPLEFKEMNWIIRKIMVAFTRVLLRKAIGASYVTEEYLQKKYPCRSVEKGVGFSSYYSSISLSENDIVNQKKKKSFGNVRLIHVSNSISNNIKGHCEVIDIAKRLIDKGIECEVRFIGDGSAVNDFKYYAKKKKIEEKVYFIGRISSHEKLMCELKKADLFIFPTKLGEGLPRAVIEAMAVGLPCIVAPAGGMYELIEEKYIVPVFDIDRYVQKIQGLCSNNVEYQRVSERNISIAKRYVKSKLDVRRSAFYYELRERTEIRKGLV